MHDFLLQPTLMNKFHQLLLQSIFYYFNFFNYVAPLIKVKCNVLHVKNKLSRISLKYTATYFEIFFINFITHLSKTNIIFTFFIFSLFVPSQRKFKKKNNFSISCLSTVISGMVNIQFITSIDSIRNCNKMSYTISYV